MICKNCGAEFDTKDLLCPYCNTENFDEAKRQQEDYIKAYKEKSKALGKEAKQMSEKIVKKATKSLFYMLLGLLGGLALILLVIFAFSKITKGDMLAQQEKEIQKLEDYYQNAEYEKMCEYLEKIDKRGGSFEKYHRIEELHQGLDWRVDSLANNYYAMLNNGWMVEAPSIEMDIRMMLEPLATISEMEKYDFPYGEEVGALYYREQYMNAMKTYLLLTEEEINSAVAEYQRGNEDYLELAEISLQRLEELAQ